jgi:hypothetical protein
MYLFTRRGRMAGGQTRAGMMWATEITQRVNQVTDIGATLHAQMFSNEVGELAWAAAVPDLGTLEAAFDKLLVDDFYVAEQDRASVFMDGPPADRLAQVVHGEIEPTDVGGYTTAITTTCRSGKLERGLTAAVELAQKAEGLGGARTAVVMGTTGSFGSITWLSSHPGIDSLQATEEAINSDPGWASFVDERVGDVYSDAPMVSMQAIYRRVA